MLDTAHRGLTLRVAPQRTATPQPARREAAPKVRPLGEALAGSAALATVIGLVVAPVAVFFVSGLTMALMAMLVGVPSVAASWGAVFQRRASAREIFEAQHALLRLAVGAVTVAAVVAVGGLGYLTANLGEPAVVASALPQVLGGSAYALVIAAAAVGATLELRRR